MQACEHGNIEVVKYFFISKFLYGENLRKLDYGILLVIASKKGHTIILEYLGNNDVMINNKITDDNMNCLKNYLSYPKDREILFNLVSHVTFDYRKYYEEVEGIKLFYQEIADRKDMVRRNMDMPSHSQGGIQSHPQGGMPKVMIGLINEYVID